MKQNSLTKQFKLTVYTSVVGIWLFSTAFNLTQSVQESVDRYHVSSVALHFIQSALSLPVLFIYLAVAFAAITFAIYTQRIEKSKEEVGYTLITRGLFLTLGYFIASSLLSIFQHQYSDGQDQSTYIIIRNYIYLVLNLGIYWYFWQGSKQLVSTLKSKTGLLKSLRVTQVFIIFFTAMYTYLVFQNPYRTESSSELVKPTYALPDGLIVVTIILPYLVTWLFAAMAAVNFAYYAKNVNGIVFKKLFRNLANGFALITGLTIILQMITQFSDFWANTGLQSILLLIAGIFIALVVAYLQLGVAARKLDRIETV